MYGSCSLTHSGDMFSILSMMFELIPMCLQRCCVSIFLVVIAFHINESFPFFGIPNMIIFQIALSFLLFVYSHAYVCTVKTKNIKSDIVNQILCLQLQIEIENDIEIAYIENPQNINTNIYVKQRNVYSQNTQEDVFQIDKDFCHDEIEPITHNKENTLTFCSKNIPSGFYQTRISVSDVYISARHRNGNILSHQCHNVDSQNYRLMNLRFPIKNLNACKDITSCSEHIRCHGGSCSFPTCKSNIVVH